ncbi:class I SAM-dependent methyltransferase, partial [Candidatus Heimdallarchaeota archaeon]
MVKKYFDANKELWNSFAKIHYDLNNDSYDVEGFLKGDSTIRDFELEEMDSIKDKKLLHLQCHFGLDTLSLAREGARVTGIDFSEDAITLARNLAEKANLDARFICSNLYKLKDVLDEKFDIVYTSFGVLCWLNDLQKWGEIISHFLKPEGFFYMAEGHPTASMFDNDHETELQLKYNYFHSAEPFEFVADGSYAESAEKMKPKKEYEWAHSFSDIINALLEAGLTLQFVHEYPFAVWK